jgi:hypothetical protein
MFLAYASVLKYACLLNSASHWMLTRKIKKCHISIKTWQINVLTANKNFLYAEKDDIPQVSRTIVNYIEYHYINARETRRENYEWTIPWYTDNIRNKTQNKDKWKTPHRKNEKNEQQGCSGRVSISCFL